MSLVKELRCSYCGAPLSFEPGEILATCRYCGFTVVINTGQAFTFEHSMFLNKYTPTQTEELARKWMSSGFLKPKDLAKKSKVTENTLIYMPFWVVSVKAESTYNGVFERISPPIVKNGKISKNYDWLVLARKAAEFPTKEYDVPLSGKIPYDFSRIDEIAKVLNSEIDEGEAVAIVRQEIEGHHRYLAQQDVDRIIEMKTELEITQIVYLHAPVWLLKYEYAGKNYVLWLDGAAGTVIKGEIPPAKFGII